MELGLREIKDNAIPKSNIVNIQMNENIYCIGKGALSSDFLRNISDIPRNLKIVGDYAIRGDELDKDTIEKIKAINPNAITYGYSSCSVSMSSSYDYDMKEKQIKDTVFNNEDDSKYDNEEYVPTLGNYVNYNYNQNASTYISSSYTGESTQTFYTTKGLKWRILNIDEKNGKVDLISDRPTDEILKLNNSAGYNNAVYMMNVICQKLYKSSKYDVSVRNINLKDVEECMGTNGIQARNNYVSSRNVKYGVGRLYSGDIKYPSLYEKQKGTLNDGYYPELTKANPDPYEESDKINTKYVSGSWNKINTDYTAFTQTAYRLPINMQYFNRGIDVLRSNEKYFIAARSLDTVAGSLRFGVRCASDSIDFINIYGDFDSNGYDSEYPCGYGYDDCSTYGCDEYENKVAAEAHLRPVVTIDLSIIKDRDENGSWNLKEN